VAFARKTLLRRGNPSLAIRLRIGYVRNRPNWSERQDGANLQLDGRQ